MSYDIEFGVKTVAEDRFGEKFAVIAVPELSSPTYNLREMFVACMDWDYKQGKWYPATDALEHIRHGIRELEDHREKYLEYNPPNGWGTLDGALECLRNWDEELTYHYGELHAWDIENVWFRW